MLYIVAELKPLEEINPETINEETPEDGITVISGQLVDSDESVIQSVRFDKEMFDEESAKKWLDENEIVDAELTEVEIEEPDSTAEDDELEEPDEEMSKHIPEDEEEDPKKKKKSLFKKSLFKKESYSLEDIEIMRVGVWNDISFTTDDLDDMVTTFTETRKQLKPYLKLGHDNEQPILQSDGMPSAGWVTKLMRKGDAIFVNIENIPKKIYKLIKEKRYGRFSAEIFRELKIDGKYYKLALRAISLLGADTPAVTNMTDLIDLYKQNENVQITYSQIITTDEGNNMPENFSQELDNVKSDNQRLKNQVDAMVKERRSEKTQAFIKLAIEQGKIIPAQAKLYTALMMNNEVQTFSVDNKKLSTFDLVSQIVETAKPVVDFTTQSHNYKPDKQSESEQLSSKIEKYMDKNKKISYQDAYSFCISEEK